MVDFSLMQIGTVNNTREIKFFFMTTEDYRQPLIFKYIFPIKLATLMPCIKFQILLPLQTIILLGYLGSFFTIEKYEHGFFTKVLRTTGT